jgi:hypothetical protein
LGYDYSTVEAREKPQRRKLSANGCGYLWGYDEAVSSAGSLLNRQEQANVRYNVL